METATVDYPRFVSERYLFGQRAGFTELRMAPSFLRRFGAMMRVGDTFTPVPRRSTPAAQRWLRRAQLPAQVLSPRFDAVEHLNATAERALYALLLRVSNGQYDNGGGDDDDDDDDDDDSAACSTHVVPVFAERFYFDRVNRSAERECHCARARYTDGLHHFLAHAVHPSSPLLDDDVLARLFPRVCVADDADDRRVDASLSLLPRYLRRASAERHWCYAHDNERAMVLGDRARYRLRRSEASGGSRA